MTLRKGGNKCSNPHVTTGHATQQAMKHRVSCNHFKVVVVSIVAARCCWDTRNNHVSICRWLNHMGWEGHNTSFQILPNGPELPLLRFTFTSGIVFLNFSLGALKVSEMLWVWILADKGTVMNFCFKVNNCSRLPMLSEEMWTRELYFLNSTDFLIQSQFWHRHQRVVMLHLVHSRSRNINQTNGSNGLQLVTGVKIWI